MDLLSYRIPVSMHQTIECFFRKRLIVIGLYLPSLLTNELVSDQSIYSNQMLDVNLNVNVNVNVKVNVMMIAWR